MADGYAGRHNSAVRSARLLQQKKHRLERRCFLIEGPLLLQAALEAGASIEHVFVAGDDQLNGLEGLERLPPTIRVDERTLDSLSQTKTPQGIVAVARFIDRDASELPQVLPTSGPAVVLVLPNLSDPGNAGTLIRSAEAFGAGAVCFGPGAVDPYNDKVVRASMGSLFKVPIVRYQEWSSFVAAARAATLHIVAAEASGTDVRDVTLPERACLVIGQEHHGFADLPREDIDTVVALPQRAGVDSLNAAVAGSLLLYEFDRAHHRATSAQAGTSRA